MWITEFKNYKAFLKAHLKTYPKAGRGQSRKIADHLNVAPIAISHVLSGDRHFTPDQGLKVCELFGFDETTTEFFLMLVNLERADTKSLKDFYKKKLNAMTVESQRVRSIAKETAEVSELDKGKFYSNWYYSAVALMMGLPGYDTVDAISEHLGLSKKKVREIVSFLLSNGVAVEENGRLKIGKGKTHVPDDSPFVNNHRRNWRHKAMEAFAEPSDGDLFFVAPSTLSKEDAEAIRRELLEFIKEFYKRLGPSKDETFYCLNIDWFKL